GSAILDLQSRCPRTKRMPSKNHLELIYSDGVLTLLSNYYEGVFSLSFENNESGEYYEIPSIFVGESISFELTSGVYQVDAISTDGTILSGIMEIL
ncbi:MAG: hypothetical protein K2O47_08330, partial [Muribaculaceae bacterium]|nr:hypothetical protein [Muribaculaceae bacterium]